MMFVHSYQTVWAVQEMTRSSTLIATLGLEPQVVTLVLDHLQAIGERVTDVVVLHTSPTSQLIEDVLRKEFNKYPDYAEAHITLHPVQIEVAGKPIADITSADEANAVLQILYEQVSKWQGDDRRIHVCPAGGRKPMAMYAMLVAQLLFDDHDRLWMLISTEALRQSGLLHGRYGESWLLPVPVHTGLAAQHRFVTSLPTAEREVLELLAREGLSFSEIGERRVTTERTVEAQLQSIRQKAGDALGETSIDRQVLITQFAPYYLLRDSLGGIIQD